MLNTKPYLEPPLTPAKNPLISNGSLNIVIFNGIV